MLTKYCYSQFISVVSNDPKLSLASKTENYVLNLIETKIAEIILEKKLYVVFNKMAAEFVELLLYENSS